MDLNWSLDDSSSYIQCDESDPGASTDAQGAAGGEAVTRQRQNRLLAIDDDDFEALIEILGTDGDRERVRQTTENNGLGDCLLTQGRERRGCRDGAAPDVASSNRTSNGPVPSDAKEQPLRSPSKITSEPARPSSPDTRALRESTMPPNSSPKRQALSATDRTRNQLVPTTARTSSPGPSQPTERPNSRQGTRSKSNLGFTQAKQYLGSSVADAKDQVADLRTRLQILKGEVKEFAPHLYRRAFDDAEFQAQPESSRNRRYSEERRPIDAKGKGKAVQWTNSVNGEYQRRAEREIIESLTENEAKNALTNVCRTLRLNPATLTASPTQSRPSEPPVPPSSLSDIARALRLVADLDELVWMDANRRDSQSGPSYGMDYNAYNEENIRAILVRVRLWERIARSRTGHRHAV